MSRSCRSQNSTSRSVLHPQVSRRVAVYPQGLARAASYPQGLARAASYPQGAVFTLKAACPGEQCGRGGESAWIAQHDPTGGS